MKVLILSTYDIQGGAARAAFRIHSGFLNLGIESKMLVQKKYSSNPTVIGPDTKFQKLLAFARPTLDQVPVRKYKNKSKTLFSPSWLSNPWVFKKIKELNPDVINLHWVCNGFLSIKDIGKLKKLNKPIVWTLHDMWAFTGGEHLDENQNHWHGSCGNFKVLNSNKKNDLSYKVWNKKRKYWKDLELTIITPSKWLGDCAKRSSLFKNMRVEVIPNCLDTEKFKPVDKSFSRNILNLPIDKKIILFGAMDATVDPNKGFENLKGALEKLNLENIELVVFGSQRTEKGSLFNFPVHYLGRLHDDISLRMYYSAADVLIQPSLQENLSNVIMESLACGVPVVAFDIGGNSDMLAHGANGYLAKPFSSEDLINGILWALQHPCNKNETSVFDNKNIRSKFCEKKISRRYIDLFQGILNGK